MGRAFEYRKATKLKRQSNKAKAMGAHGPRVYEIG